MLIIGIFLALVLIPTVAGLAGDPPVHRRPMDRADIAYRAARRAPHIRAGLRWAASYHRGPQTRIGRYALRRSIECFQRAADQG